MKLPREYVDTISLRYHLALVALATGHGAPDHVQWITEALLACSFLVESGYGSIESEMLWAANAAAVTSFEQGKHTGAWFLDEETVERYAAILTLHDDQLKTAPAGAIIEAVKKLDAMRNKPALCGPVPVTLRNP